MPVPAFSLLTGADSATASDSADTEVSSASLADSSFATDFSCSVLTTGSSSGFVLDSSWSSEEEPVKSGAMLDSKEGNEGGGERVEVGGRRGLRGNCTRLDVGGLKWEGVGWWRKRSELG